MEEEEVVVVWDDEEGMIVNGLPETTAMLCALCSVLCVVCAILFIAHWGSMAGVVEERREEKGKTVVLLPFSLAVCLAGWLAGWERERETEREGGAVWFPLRLAVEVFVRDER